MPFFMTAVKKVNCVRGWSSGYILSFIYLPVWNLISIMNNDMSVNELHILKSDMIIGFLNLFQLWILPSMVGGSVLYFLSVDRWHCVAAWLYGSGLTGLFITSTLFHTAAWKISHRRCVFVCVLGGRKC